MEENQNLLRLRALLEVATRALQQLFLRTFKSKFPASPPPYHQALLPLLNNPYKNQRELVAQGDVTKWDISLLCLILQTREFKQILSKEEKASLRPIQETRNACSHLPNGVLDDEDFDRYFTRLESVLTQAKLCDLREIALIKSPPDDVEDEREAKQAAITYKEDGNRAFRASRFQEALEFFSQGILLGGLIDPLVLSDIYGNRSSTHLKLGDAEAAVIDAESAVRVSPMYHKSHYRLALAHRQANNIVSAVTSLEQAVAFCSKAEEKAKFKDLLDEWRYEMGSIARNEDMDLNYLPGHQSKAQREKFVAQFGGDAGTVGKLDEMLKSLPKSSDETMQGYVEFAKASRLMEKGKHKEAVNQLKIAASEYDNTEAMYNLGHFMMEGTGTPKDLYGGFEWILRAANRPVLDEPAIFPFKMRAQGVAAANLNLGTCYDDGVCVPVNPLVALEHWKRAAELQFAPAWNTLGACYHNGSHGLNVDLDEAMAYYLKAANDGHAGAMGNLAELNARLGRFSVGLMWAKSAREHGNLRAAKVEDFCAKNVDKEMTLAPEMMEALSSLRIPPPSSTPLVMYNKLSTLAEFDQALNEFPSPFMQRLRDIRFGFEELSRMLDVTNNQAMMEFFSSTRGLIDLTSRLYKLMSLEDSYLAYDSAFVHAVCSLLGIIPERLKQALNPLHVGTILLANSSIEIGKQIASTEQLVVRFPDNYVFRFKLSCLLMFEGPHANFERSLEISHKLLSELQHVDDADVQKMGLLYHLGACYFKLSSNKSKTITSKCVSFLERFIKVGEKDGHRKVSIAHYTLGVLALKPHRIEDATWLRHLEAGKVADAKLPPCFREDKCVSRKMLDGLFMISEKAPPPPPVAASSGRFQRRTEKERPWLDELRKNSAAMAKVSSERRGTHTVLSTTQKAPLESVLRPADRGSKMKPMSLELLLGPRKDKVYWGTSLLCVVVNEVVRGPSLHVAVEDDQRYPTLLCIYGYTEAMVKEISIGTVILIRNPYARAASDGNMMIRVDNLNTMEILKSSQLYLCWGCLKSFRELSLCSKCNKAAYCSPECQKKGWSTYGHKFHCKQ